MPIKGISEKRRLPRVGKVRLGIKTENAQGATYPKAVDYFVVNDDQSTSAAAACAFHQTYPGEPKSIDIAFPSDNPEEFFQQWYRRYGKAKGLICKGDGEVATRLDEATGEMVEIECTPECEYLAKKHCRPVGSLQFLIPSITGIAVWQIDTGSYHSIVNLNSAIDMVRSLTGGRIAFIPLKLVIREREAQPNGTKKIINVLDIALEELNIPKLLEASNKVGAALMLPSRAIEQEPEELYVDGSQEFEVVDESASLGNETAEELHVDCRGLCQALNMTGAEVRKDLKDLYKVESVDVLTLDQLKDYRDRCKIALDMSGDIPF